MLITIDHNGAYHWDLAFDTGNFWDRFLDGLAEERQIIPNECLNAIELDQINNIFIWARDTGEAPTCKAPTFEMLKCISATFA